MSSGPPYDFRMAEVSDVQFRGGSSTRCCIADGETIEDLISPAGPAFFMSRELALSPTIEACARHWGSEQYPSEFRSWKGLLGVPEAGSFDRYPGDVEREDNWYLSKLTGVRTRVIEPLYLMIMINFEKYTRLLVFGLPRLL